MSAPAWRPARGFSLVELLASAAIVGILASVAVPVIETTVKRQKERDLRQALRDIRGAIDAYKLAASSGKILVAEGDSGYPPSLTDLSAGVQDQSNKTGPRLYFLRRIPRDPFAANAAAPAADTWGMRAFDSPPDAPRSGKDVFDVYSLSSRIGVNGLSYKEW